MYYASELQLYYDNCKSEEATLKYAECIQRCTKGLSIHPGTLGIGADKYSSIYMAYDQDGWITSTSIIMKCLNGTS